MPDLPTGTVTFLFTDVEGSTQLWEQSPAAMKAATTRHDALVEEQVARHGGIVVRPRGEGDSRFAVFARASDAVAAAAALQGALHAEAWPTPRPLRVRLALHTGEADLRDGDYYGAAVNRCARLRAIANGGQVLLSQTTHDLVRGALPLGVSLRDVGEQRLADLSVPERVYQLLHASLQADFPPLKSLDAYPNNLPLQMTSFVGREREIAEVAERLRAARLVTLTGSGGCGKTRLALQVGADLLDRHPDGVWFVDLAPLTDPTVVPQAVATALGVHEVPGRPLLATLTDYLRSRAILVILDNCEHLLDACTQLADTLLRTCARLRLLVTSRELLGVPGEIAWRVPSLSLPDPRQPLPVANLTQHEAVRLFLDRAVAALPGFAVTNQNAPAVAQICWRLDGIPLAIELAAARVRMLTVEQIAARLDDRFRLLTGGSRTALRRQQTLQAAIDWSYQLLAEAERLLLQRLSVFAGGWTLEAAEAVGAGEGIAGSEVLDLLGRLVDKSLVVAEGQGAHARYRLLETIRQYASQKLVDVGEAAAARARHRDWYLGLAEQALPAMYGRDQKRWLDRLEAEHDNLRAALAWSAANPADTPTLLRLAGLLGMFWRYRGYNREAIGWLNQAVARGEAAPSADRARALNWLGHLEWIEGNSERSQPLLEESVAEARVVGDKRVLAHALRHLSYTITALGDRAQARRLAEEAVAVGREADFKREVAYSLHTLAWLIVGEGSLDAIEPLLSESLAVARESGDAATVCEAMCGLCWLYYQRGEIARARAILDESLALARRGDPRWALPIALAYLADLAAAEQDLARAIDWYRQCLREAAIDAARGLVVYVLGRYAAVCSLLREHRRAACLFGAASSAIQDRTIVMTFMLFDDSGGAGADIEATRRGLGEDVFATAWAEGQAMTLEQAVAYALEDGG